MINLNGEPINNHTDLKHRIMKLNALKEEQEIEIKNGVKELYYSLQPEYMIKNAIHRLAEDPELTTDLKKVGVGLGTDYVIRRFFGKQLTIKGYISSLIFNKVAAHLLNEYEDVISDGIRKLKSVFKRKRKEDHRAEDEGYNEKHPEEKAEEPQVQPHEEIH